MSNNVTDPPDNQGPTSAPTDPPDNQSPTDPPDNQGPTSAGVARGLIQYKLFLGGTAGNNNWRERLTQLLIDLGVNKESIFNPVVADWNEEAQQREDAVKAQAPVVLYYIADPQQTGNPISAYSIFEAQQALYDDPARTVVVFDYDGLSGHPLTQMRKIFNDLVKRFPSAAIFNELYPGSRTLRALTDRMK